MRYELSRGLVFQSGQYPIFRCNQCGSCCFSTPSITMADVMRLTPNERENLEVLFNVLVTYPVVVSHELLFVNEVSPVIISPKSVKNRCVFYKNHSCSIHEHKPGECALNPFSVSVGFDGKEFVAKPFTPNFCSGLMKGSSANRKTDSVCINHLTDMIMHEYFIINLPKIPPTINQLIGLWVNDLKKLRANDLVSMLKVIDEKRKSLNSLVMFRSCV
ncbi:MAG TPA: YkgJ family cysteine cluster protein [Candidatus Nanoarchaeia archaeon]|nr:YkgJ family cysteine cluster protein [Candidatus Nanoarchaeia archaeon]